MRPILRSVSHDLFARMDLVIASDTVALDEARQIEGAGPLVDLLTDRLAKCGAWRTSVDEAVEALVQVERTYDAAVDAQTRAQAGLALGSLDPTEAVRLADDAECANQARRIRERELAEAKSRVESLLNRFQKFDINRGDRDQARARDLAGGIVKWCLKGHVDIAFESAKTVLELSAEALMWIPLFERREIRDYAKQANRTFGTAAPIDDVQRVFARLPQIVDAHRRKLENELRRIGGDRDALGDLGAKS